MKIAREVPDISDEMLPSIAQLLKLSAVYLKCEDKYYLLWEKK